jgi:hypothetical protein
VLARQEQKLIDKSRKFVEEIKALEAAEDLNREVGVLKASIIPSTLGLD